VDHLFFQELSESAEEDADGYLVRSFAEPAGSVVPARKTGYIESIVDDTMTDELNGLYVIGRQGVVE
jgi:hypothetical protein